MSIAHKDRILKALDQMRLGLLPFVQAEMTAVFKDRWQEELANRTRAELVRGELRLDVQALLKAINGCWEEVFKHQLDRGHRNFVHEAVDVRNKFAHDHVWSGDDTDRALDTIGRLLAAVGATSSWFTVPRLRGSRADLVLRWRT